MVPVDPRKWTSTFVEFCRMKTMSRIRSRSAAPVATQTALARVSRGAPGAGEPSPEDGVAADPSSDDEEGGGPVAMIPIFLSSRCPPQDFLLNGARERQSQPGSQDFWLFGAVSRSIRPSTTTLPCGLIRP
jgi:hypothetical protein